MAVDPISRVLAPAAARSLLDAETASVTQHFIIDLLDELTAEWNSVRIEPGSGLGELGLESISLVYLLAEVQLEYGLNDALFGALRSEEHDVKEMTVAELASVADGLVAHERMIGRAV